VIGAAFGETLASAQAGGEAAFAAVFRDVQPALVRYLRVIASEPEDVASDTWLQVLAGLGRFRGGEQEFRAWLFTIARHRATDAGRSRGAPSRGAGGHDGTGAGADHTRRRRPGDGGDVRRRPHWS
jgi:RNA polymerase sigma-70 factor (ECF subfamily)